MSHQTIYYIEYAFITFITVFVGTFFAFCLSQMYYLCTTQFEYYITCALSAVLFVGVTVFWSNCVTTARINMTSALRRQRYNTMGARL